MAYKNFREGQIWISHTVPHTLNYYTCGKIHEITAAEKFTIGSGVMKGCLVAAKLSGSQIVLNKAAFPTDINSVVGIVKDIAYVGTDSTGDQTASFVNEGLVIVPSTCIDGSTATVGDVLYWSTDPAKPGMMTKSTPNADVKYNNLPVVGIVTAKDGDNYTVFVNMSDFDSTIEFTGTMGLSPTTADGTKSFAYYLPSRATDRVSVEITNSTDTDSFSVYTIPYKNVPGNSSSIQFAHKVIKDSTTIKIVGSINYNI